MNDQQRYIDALHAMQTGVAMEMAQGSKATDPKHLRVGVNAAMSDHGGLVKLLIAKGLFTAEEYLAAIANQMETEQADYEIRLGVNLG